MKRVMAIATAAAALFLSLQVGSAQQPSPLRFNATAANDLRTWDQFVTAQERGGGLRVTQVAQDPSLPSRTVERLQQYYRAFPCGVPKSCATWMAVCPSRSLAISRRS